MKLSDDERRQHCYKVVNRLFSHHKWSLITRDEIVEQILDASLQHPNAELSYLAFGVYNQTLYNACSGKEGPLRWEQGYRELFEMLCAQARHRYPDLWEDAVQIALALTCERFERCRVPQAFFQFAWGYFRNAIRHLQPHRRRKGNVAEISIDGSDDGAGGELLLSAILPDPDARPEEQALTAEQRAELNSILRALEQEHPRAYRQLAAVRLKYLEGEEDTVISEILRVPVKRVHEL